jgi:hypothetical protein
MTRSLLTACPPAVPAVHALCARVHVSPCIHGVRRVHVERAQSRHEAVVFVLPWVTCITSQCGDCAAMSELQHFAVPLIFSIASLLSVDHKSLLFATSVCVECLPLFVRHVRCACIVSNTDSPRLGMIVSGLPWHSRRARPQMFVTGIENINRYEDHRDAACIILCYLLAHGTRADAAWAPPVHAALRILLESSSYLAIRDSYFATCLSQGFQSSRHHLDISRMLPRHDRTCRSASHAKRGRSTVAALTSASSYRRFLTIAELSCRGCSRSRG